MDTETTDTPTMGADTIDTEALGGQSADASEGGATRAAQATRATGATRKHKWPVIVARLVILAMIIVGVAAYLLNPDVRTALNSIVAMFASGDFSVIKDFVASYGAYAALISFLLMVFQSVAAPLPAFLITFANANLFGWWQGAILSWSSAMVGAAVCFYIARVMGRDVVEKLTTKVGLKQIDTFFERHGRTSILIARLLPFISFDIVSYAAGLTSMSFWSFFIATGIGQLPATIIYSYVGGMLTGGAQMFVTALLIIFALSALAFLARQIYLERAKRKAAAKPGRAADASGGTGADVLGSTGTDAR